MKKHGKYIEKHGSEREGSKRIGCLSCGTIENIGTRRYCSIQCRQKLRRNLDVRTGLLKALNTEYATFYFTDLEITLNILPYGSREIFSFSYPRSPGKKPVQDFKAMSNMLGNEWWQVKKKTSKSYLASQHLMKLAHRNNVPVDSVKPLVNKMPAIKGKSLILLKLSKLQIDSPDPKQIIKRAYRQQAKRHHPDLGGKADEFRKIRQAYEELLQWAKNPRFLRRKGFPDKWFYHGNKDRWLQPVRYKEWSKV